jgi:hypothetical protein
MLGGQYHQSDIRMAKKIGRNEPCWCGSGLKYKKCHLGRLQMPKVPISEALEKLSEAYGAEYCLHPDKQNCSGDIIRAHTIQRNGGLSKIARKNHVYSFFGNNPADINKNKGILAPKLTGLKKASTFTGFCGNHDDSVFAPIEKNPFVASQEHAFLLGYRAICRELFTKQAVSGLISFFRTLDQGRDVQSQFVLQNQIDRFSLGTSTGLQDVERCKSEYDKTLLSNDYSQVSYYIIRFANTPDVMCSAGQFPSVDFDGNRLQDLGDLNTKLDHLTFSVIATDNGGAAVFSWLGNSPASVYLVKSLHMQSDSDLPHSLVRYVFEFFENAFFSPNWWDSLDETARNKIGQRFSLAANPFEKRRSDCLKDDGIRVVSWHISSRETNLSL